MSQVVGSFVAGTTGDSGSALRYTVTQDGTAMDVAGATSITLSMVRQTSAGDVTDSISGTVYGAATNGTFEFTPVGTALAAPASRAAPEVYECRISFVIATKTYWTEAFRLAAVKFP